MICRVGLKSSFVDLREYAHLALNWDELESDLNSHLISYGLSGMKILKYMIMMKWRTLQMNEKK